MKCLVTLYVHAIQIDARLSSIGERCTNLISLSLESCFSLNSREVKFDGLKYLKEFRGSKGPGKTPFAFRLTRNLRNLSQLIRLKRLNLKHCTRLVKLPELPSSIAIIIADGCDKLTTIGDLNENCKWLCYISLDESPVIDGNRLLQSMLKGNAIENQSMFLRIKGLEIPKQFTNRLYAGDKCRLPLPVNWCNDFCGFLICAVLEHCIYSWTSPKITIQEEASDDMRGMFHDVVWGESFGGKLTWVWYVSFASLRRTEWWNPTHKNVSFHIDQVDSTSIGIGASLVRLNNGSGLTDTSTDSSEFTDDYTPKISIRHDSKSSLTISPRVYR
ncbi:Toll/interleukin-1 receptor domain-containing protein [Tanacetum coccineum]